MQVVYPNTAYGLLQLVPKKPDPLDPQQQQLYLVLDYRSLNTSVNAAHNDNSVISY